MTKKFNRKASSSSLVVEYSSHQPKIKASSPAIGTKREEMATNIFIEEVRGSRPLVEHSSHQPNIKALSPAIGTGREEMATKSLIERPMAVM